MGLAKTLLGIYHGSTNNNNSYKKYQPKTTAKVDITQLISEGVLKNTLERSVLESLFNKVSGLRPAASSKKRLRHRCVSVNFAKLLGTPFFIEHLRTTDLGRAQNFTINGSKSNC